MDSYDIEVNLEILNTIESGIELLTEPLKTEVQNLPLKLSFLRAILAVTGKSYIQDDRLQALLDRARSVSSNGLFEYTQLHSDFYQIGPIDWSGSMPINMDGQICSMQKGLEFLVPDVQEIYTIVSKSSRSIAEMTNEFAMKHLDLILKNIEDLLRCRADSFAPVKEEVEAVHKTLRFLRDFLGFTAKWCSKLWKIKDLLILAEVVTDNISCLLFLCLVKSKMDDQMLRQMKLEFSKQLQSFDPAQSDARKTYIQALKSLKSEGNHTPLDEFALDFLKSLQDNLLELSLSDIRPSFLASVKDLMLDLHQELRFLKDFTMDSEWKKYSTEVDQKLKDLWEHSDALIKEAGCVIYSLYLYDYEKNESMAQDLISAASNLLVEVKIAKEGARNIYNQFVPKSLRSNFPRTDKLGSISFIIQNLKTVLDVQADSDAPLKYHIEAVLKDLQILREEFTGIEELQDQLTQFKDIVYHTECVVDFSECKGSPSWVIKLGLFDVIEEIKMIKQELKNITNAKTNEASASGVSSNPLEVSTETASPKDDEALSSNDTGNEKKAKSELVVFGEEEEKIREQITRASKKLEILSIVGMPGVGKTTLADSVFQHFSRSNNFHVLARCTITQSYEPKRLLLELLSHITDEAKQWHGQKEEDLAQKLYQILKGKKYLIFMDDIWDLGPLKNMRASLPDDENGSRILLTSRFDNIASQSDCMSAIVHLWPLSNQKSWELLQVKVFGSESCPEELEEIGKEMATICRGLPLLVDVIAGLLWETQAKRHSWQQVAERLKAQPIDDLQGRCRKVIELSYSNLPDHLRACFLYFAAFPKGRETSKWKLISMWIAEGFVRVLKDDDPRSLEVAAVTYLDDLIARNLVTASKRGELGKVKASRIHDLLHDFALAKAKEESFLQQIQKYDSDLPSLSFNGCVRSEEYRLCFYPDKKDDFNRRVHGPRARTLLCNGRLPFSFNDLCLNFELLRVLDMSNNIINDCDAIGNLIHLRFLALFGLNWGDITEIHKFRRLETFLMQKAFMFYRGAALYLEYICSLKKLRHFRLNDSFVWRSCSERVFDYLQLGNLLSLSCPILSYGKFSEKLMERMPNLQKLSCSFTEAWNFDRTCNFFPKLELLRKLESLNVKYDGDWGHASYPCKFSFPPYLKKLALGLFCLPWSEISVLGKLEHLEVLNLGREAFKGETWNMRDGEFPKLKCLILFDLDIVEWIASEHHLPCLEKLKVLQCEQLEELPSCLPEKATLQEIYLSDCRNSVEYTAQEIKEAQQDNGNDQFVLKIRREGKEKFRHTFWKG